MNWTLKSVKSLFKKKEKLFQNSDINNYQNGTCQLNKADSEKIDFIIMDKFGLSPDEISDDLDIINDCGADELDIPGLFNTIEAEFKIKVQDGAFGLTIGEIKNYVAIKLDNPKYIVPEDKLHNGEVRLDELIKLIHREHQSAQSSAIRSLVRNEYEILPDEYGNQFKELINFTLNYFSTRKFASKRKLIETIERSFPIMHPYLIRQLNMINPNLLLTETDNYSGSIIDEQKAYDEFLDFAFLHFTKTYHDNVSFPESWPFKN